MLYFWWWCSSSAAGGKWEIISNVCNKIKCNTNTMSMALESPFLFKKCWIACSNGIDDGHQIENQMYLPQYSQQLYYWKIRHNKRQHNTYWSTIGRNEVLRTSNDSLKRALPSFWIYCRYKEVLMQLHNPFYGQDMYDLVTPCQYILTFDNWIL